LKIEQLKIEQWRPDYQMSRSVAASGASFSAAERMVSWLTQIFSKPGEGSRSDAAGGHRQTPEGLKRRTGYKPCAGNGSFLLLATVPEREVLLGIAGRLGKPDFSLAPENNGTQLSSETRVPRFGPTATTKFRLDCLVVQPFSRLIRKAMLPEVKPIAEPA
jgi:hypothetical protein